MADLERINRIINESGFKKEFIAQKLGMSPTSLGSKLAGRRPFSIKEANAFCAFFGITDADEMVKLFFAPAVDESETKEY